MYNIINGKIDIDAERYFEISGQTRTRGHKWKIRPVTARLDVRKYTFFSRVWKPWNKLPEDVVSATSLLEFKRGIDDCGILKDYVSYPLAPHRLPFQRGRMWPT